MRHPGYNDLGKSDPAPAPVYVAPPAPDYASAATATAAGNLDAARLAARANRVDQYTPYGTQTFTDLGNDRWRTDINLAPEQKQLLDQQNKISLGLGGTMDKGLGYVQNMLNNPFDTSKLPDMPVTADNAGRDAMTASILARMQPGMDRTRTATENDLLIQGHNRGGEAWNAKEDDLARAENDMKLAAVQAGGAEQSRLFGLGSSARERALQEQSFLRNEPLNTLNAVRTGAQVTNPTFSPVPQQTTTAGANMLGAATAQYGGAQQNAQNNYNSQLAMYNAGQRANENSLGGLFSLGSAALGSPWAGNAFGF